LCRLDPELHCPQGDLAGLALRAVAEQADLAGLAVFLVLAPQEAADPAHLVGPMYFLDLVPQEEVGANQFYCQTIRSVHIAHRLGIGYNWM